MSRFSRNDRARHRAATAEEDHRSEHGAAEDAAQLMSDARARDAAMWHRVQIIDELPLPHCDRSNPIPAYSRLLAGRFVRVRLRKLFPEELKWFRDKGCDCAQFFEVNAADDPEPDGATLILCRRQLEMD